MNQLPDFLVWMQIEEPNMSLDYNEREGYFYHDIAEKMWKAWKVNHMHWVPLSGRISKEKLRSFKEDDFPDTLVDRLKGVYTTAMSAHKPNKVELEAVREIERLRAERDGLVMEMKWRSNGDQMKLSRVDVLQAAVGAEDKPVAWISSGDLSNLNNRDDVGPITFISNRPRRSKNIPLYTRPADDKLRKAAEEALAILEEIDSVSSEEITREAIGNLRAALRDNYGNTTETQ